MSRMFNPMANNPVQPVQGVPTPNPTGAANNVVQATGEMARDALARRQQNMEMSQFNAKMKAEQMQALTETVRHFADQKWVEKMKARDEKNQAFKDRIAQSQKDGGIFAKSVLAHMSAMMSPLDTAQSYYDQAVLYTMMDKIGQQMSPTEQAIGQGMQRIQQQMGGQPGGQPGGTNPLQDAFDVSATGGKTSSQILGTGSGPNPLGVKMGKWISDAGEKARQADEIDFTGLADPTHTADSLIQSWTSSPNAAAPWNAEVSRILDQSGAGALARLFENHVGGFNTGKTPQPGDGTVKNPSIVSHGVYGWLDQVKDRLLDHMASGNLSQDPNTMNKAREAVEQVSHMASNYMNSQGKDIMLSKALAKLSQPEFLDMMRRDPWGALQMATKDLQDKRNKFFQRFNPKSMAQMTLELQAKKARLYSQAQREYFNGNEDAAYDLMDQAESLESQYVNQYDYSNMWEDQQSAPQSSPEPRRNTPYQVKGENYSAEETPVEGATYSPQQSAPQQQIQAPPEGSTNPIPGSDMGWGVRSYNF